MHQGACETEVKSDVLFEQARQQTPDRSVVITIITWHFQFRPVNVSIPHLKYDEPFRVLLPLLPYVVPLNDGNCRFTMPVDKGRCARDALPHAFHIGVFKFVFTINTALKHIYKESTNIIEGCYVAFDTNECWNSQ